MNIMKINADLINFKLISPLAFFKEFLFNDSNLGVCDVIAYFGKNLSIKDIVLRDL